MLVFLQSLVGLWARVLPPVLEKVRFMEDSGTPLSCYQLITAAEIRALSLALLQSALLIMNLWPAIAHRMTVDIRGTGGTSSKGWSRTWEACQHACSSHHPRCQMLCHSALARRPSQSVGLQGLLHRSSPGPASRQTPPAPPNTSTTRQGRDQAASLLGRRHGQRTWYLNLSLPLRSFVT